MRSMGLSQEADDGRDPLPRSAVLSGLNSLAGASLRRGKEDGKTMITVRGHRHDNKTRQVGQVG